MKNNKTQIEEKKLVRVHSGAIHIENKTKLVQRKAWFELIYKALPSMSFQNEFSIPIKDLKEAIGWDESKNDESLKELLYQLTSISVQWNVLEKDKEVWEANSLLAGCKIVKGSGICHYAFSPFLQKKLMNPEMYAKIDLIVSHKFKSKYALAIYCLALDYLNIKINYGEKNLSLQDLRKYLGLKEEEYKLVGDLNKRVIKPSEEEINDISDMVISIVPIIQKKKTLGFKFTMKLKEERLFLYKSQKNSINEEIKQTNIFEDIEVKEIEDVKTQSIKIEVKPKREIIKVENKELKEFFAEYKISITTSTIQNKLIEVKEVFKNRFEDYLIFLMNYTKQELKRTNINNISGFYVSLLKDDNQIDNYIVEMQNKEKEKEKNREKINYLVNIELKKNYDLYSSKEFDNYLIKNIDKLEKTIVEIIKTTTKAGEFFYDLILSKHKNGVIDKTLITESKAGTKGAVISHLKKYQDRLKYKALTFEEWKANEVTEEEIKELEKNLV